MEGWTVTELAKELGIDENTVAQRINRKGIKPVSYKALYPLDTLDKIKEAKRGRPAKPPKKE
jgi:IS30 family transposase